MLLPFKLLKYWELEGNYFFAGSASKFEIFSYDQISIMETFRIRFPKCHCLSNFANNGNWKEPPFFKEPPQILGLFCTIRFSMMETYRIRIPKRYCLSTLGTERNVFLPDSQFWTENVVEKWLQNKQDARFAVWRKENVHKICARLGQL